MTECPQINQTLVHVGYVVTLGHDMTGDHVGQTARPPRRFNRQREGLARLAIWPIEQLVDHVLEQPGQ